MPELKCLAPSLVGNRLPPMASEAEYLQTLAEIFASSDDALRVGIGDDGAVVDVKN